MSKYRANDTANKTFLRKANTRLHRSLHTAFMHYRQRGGTHTFSQYYVVMSAFTKWVGQRLIDEGEVVLPRHLGRLCIVGRKIDYTALQRNKKYINWGKTQHSGTTIYNNYDSSDGHIYYMVWKKRDVKYYNVRMYRFVATIGLRRALCAAIVGGKRYIHVDDSDYVRRAPQDVTYDYDNSDDTAVLSQYGPLFADTCYIDPYKILYGDRT